MNEDIIFPNDDVYPLLEKVASEPDKSDFMIDVSILCFVNVNMCIMVFLNTGESS